MKLFKRTLALVLTLCLTLSLGILTASAAETDTITYKANGAEVLVTGSAYFDAEDRSAFVKMIQE